MDFPVAEPIARYLAEAVRDARPGLPGESDARPSLPTVFAKRMLERFGWHDRSHSASLVLTDVVQGIYLALQTLSEPGDGVVRTDAGVPAVPRRDRDELGRRRIVNELVRGPRGYEIDFDDAAREAATRGTRILLLCNPQNPTGRVFTRAELERLARARDRARPARDLRRDPRRARLSRATATSRSRRSAPRSRRARSRSPRRPRRFNIAGLRCAVAVFGSDELLRRFKSLPSPRARRARHASGSRATRDRLDALPAVARRRDGLPRRQPPLPRRVRARAAARHRAPFRRGDLSRLARLPRARRSPAGAVRLLPRARARRALATAAGSAPAGTASCA